MHYLLFICVDGRPAPDGPTGTKDACARWVEEMDARGVRLLGRELDLPAAAVTVRVRDGETILCDGPFAETKEFVAGFDVLDCADLDEAIDVAARHPASRSDTIEIRPFVDGLDVGPAALAFGRGDDRRGTPHCLLMCLDGVPAEPEVEESVVREGIAWGRDLTERGILVLAHPLHHADTATTVRVRDGRTLVSDGPFAETKEFIGGLSVLDGVGRQEAIELAAAHPLAAHHMIEVRPFLGT